MLRPIFTSTALALCLIGFSASAQIGPPDAERIEATVVDVDYADRTMTVRFDENQAVETYDVAKDAEFFTWDGVMERPQRFTDVAAGERIMLEFGGVEGHPTLSKVTEDTSSSS